jgi:hypothetical protein
VALISAVPAFTQTVANVYVLYNNQNWYTGTSVIVYNTATTGRLTKVGTYPLRSVSLLIGGTASHLYTAGQSSANVSGQNAIDTYPVKSNGAIGARTETIDTQNYVGSACADPSSTSIVSAKLDHSGHYIFVRVYNQENGDCDQWQTYSIASNGALTYLGRDESGPVGYLETISSSNAFAYGTTEGTRPADPHQGPQFYAYSRTSDLVLAENFNFKQTNPASTPSTAYSLWASADPTNHLAVLMSGDGSTTKIASYTINSTNGSISSSNTWSDMPATLIDSQEPTNSQTLMYTSMSPSGKLLAVYGGGFQFFHFNGASPLTKYTGLYRGTDGIRQAAWDNSNHFYALDFWGGQLRVYTVTPTSFEEDPGSPVNATGGAIVVVSK